MPPIKPEMIFHCSRSTIVREALRRSRRERRRSISFTLPILCQIRFPFFPLTRVLECLLPCPTRLLLPVRILSRWRSIQLASFFTLPIWAETMCLRFRWIPLLAYPLSLQRLSRLSQQVRGQYL